MNSPDVAFAFLTLGATISGYVAPPSRLSSIRTYELEPRLWVHAIFCVEPCPQSSVVFGVVTLSAALPDTMEKGASEESTMLPLALLICTRTRAVAAAGP